MTVKAILFDLDGTLVDSIHDLTESLNQLLAGLGHPPYSTREVIGFVGKGVQYLVTSALTKRGVMLTPAEAKQKAADFLSIYEPRASRLTRAFPGVVETLQALGADYRLAVVTNKPTDATLRILKDLDLAGYFVAVLGGDWGGPTKPAPDPLLAAVKMLGATPATALMVGDSNNDILAAKAAGVRAVAVSFGYAHGPAAELGADAVIDRMTDLSHLL